MSQAPVRLLLVVPSPINDPNRLSLNAELAEINAALDQVRAPVDIVRLYPPTVGNLRLALATRAFQIVHVAAHAGTAGVELEDDDGTAVHLGEDQFAELFADGQECLLVLNGCSTEPLAQRIGQASSNVTTLSIGGDLDRHDAIRLVGALYRHIFAETLERAAWNAADALRHRRVRDHASPVQVRGRQVGRKIADVQLGIDRPTYYSCMPPSNVRSRHVNVVDRVTEVLRIHEFFTESDNGPFSALVGIPGSGKTTVAQTAAHRYGWRFPDGTGWVSLRGGFSITDLQQAFGWTTAAASVSPVVQAARRLSSGCHLLILDDMEEAGPEAVAEVRDLLSAWDTALGGRAILVFHTHRTEFQDLIGANWVTVKELPADAASDLMIACLGGLEKTRRILGADVSEASRLCLGHPKTIESAASLLQTGHRWADLKAYLHQRRGGGPLVLNDEMLGGVITRLEARAAAVRDLLDAWTVIEDGCNESVWRRLAFGNSPDMSAEARLDEALAALHSATLIDRYDIDGDRRCVMHPLLVAHLRRRHEGMSRERTRQLVTMQLAEQARLAVLDDYPAGEAANIGRVLRLAHSLDMHRDIVGYGITAVGDGQRVLVRHGPWQLAREVLDLAVEAAEAEADDEQVARFLLARGTVEYRLADFAAASQSYEMAESRADAAGSPLLHMLALRGSGQLLYRAGELDQAERVYERARQLAACEADTADIDHQLGKVAYRRGQFAEARDLFRRVCEARRQAGRVRDLAKTLHELARIEHALGDHRAARALYEEALLLERQVKDTVTEQATLFQLGRLALDEGRIPDADGLLAESRSLSEELGDEVWMIHADYGQALLAYARHDYPSAIRNAQIALEKSRKMHIGLSTEIRDWMTRVPSLLGEVSGGS
ncbi:MAG TPA: tetratricopeptide repeat protein [Streptosporangiaceae bacterium]|nr:tetratricopeptide repeat protein [Streptosporangiaceae bacterium]